MIKISKHFIADDKDKTGDINSQNSLRKSENPAEKTDEGKSDKKETIIDKIKDALQDWSNDNEKDIEEDDNSALRSGL